VQDVTVTQTTPTTTAEVLGVQLARTGFSSGLLLLGAGLIAVGLVIEIGTRRRLAR
jgi:hypothetical protein